MESSYSYILDDDRKLFFSSLDELHINVFYLGN